MRVMDSLRVPCVIEVEKEVKITMLEFELLTGPLLGHRHGWHMYGSLD